MHEQAKQFIAAVKENAAKCWDQPDDKDFIEKLLYVYEFPNGSVSISDNFEKFFSIMYRVDKDGNWFVRRMYSDEPADQEKPYTFECAMSDASIMYTG